MEEIVLLKDAYKKFNLDLRDDLSEKILNYISQRIYSNRDLINRLIELYNLEITFDDIIKTFNDAYHEKDFYKNVTSYMQGVNYYQGVMPMPIGNILVDTNDPKEVIKYFVYGIRSRNTITIAQTEYNELSLSNMMLIIFVEALAKFNISRNTLMIMPYEDCYQEEFDEVIELEENENSFNQRNFINEVIIYIDNQAFAKEALEEEKILKEKNIKYRILKSSLEESLDVINRLRPRVAIIYTENNENAYSFINLAASPNVFVNASSMNAEDLNDKKNKLYYKKKVIFPSGVVLEELNGELEDTKKETQEETREKIELQEEIQEVKVDEVPEEIVDKEETALTEIVNPWYKKVIDAIKKFFRR